MNRETLVKQGLTTSSLQAQGPARAWRCCVEAGPDRDRAVELGARPVVVGADAGCDLVLTDPAVSRRHLELRVRADGVAARDLDSTNGCFFESSRFSEIVVTDGARVTVGDSTLRLTATRPRTIAPSARTRFGGLIGQSLAMRELFAVLELVSPTEVTVLLEGESGTGKELAARALHDHSARAAGPFEVVDCGAASAQLIESQLFGHLRGAFTGAVSDRLGAFAQADGGTLFLDEIAELPLELQPKLLRAIEARTIQPLGAERPQTVDVRIGAATNRDLGRRVASRDFRFDLYQRLAVVHLRLPPLRERREDIPALIAYLYESWGVDPGPNDGAKLHRLMRHSWPGNVRELRNTLERARVLSGAEAGAAPFTALPLDLELSEAGAPAALVDITLPFKQAKERWLELFERRYLASLYAACDGNLSEAERRAGVNRNHLRRLLEKHGLRK